jgi:osmotically-inducible protein OsmY
MNIACKVRVLIICAYWGPVVFGLGGFATPASAQNAASPPGAAVLTDGELEKRVKAALHADPYFYDRHVTVSVEQGAVVLRGFVFSAGDLQQALRIARKAAGGRRVVDDLSVKQGGRR